MQLIINKELDGDKVILKLDGRLDTTTAPELEAKFNEIERCAALVLDFDKLQYLSSAGLRVLLARQKMVSAKGPMVLKNVCDDIMDVFEMTGFSEILTIEK